MDYRFNYLLGILVAIVITKILMTIANYLGNQIGIGRIILGLFHKFKKP